MIFAGNNTLYTSQIFHIESFILHCRLRTRGVRGIDLESIGAQAENIFGTCEESEVLDLDGNGGKTFLRVLLQITTTVQTERNENT